MKFSVGYVSVLIKKYQRHLLICVYKYKQSATSQSI